MAATNSFYLMLAKSMARDVGIDPERISISWISRDSMLVGIKDATHEEVESFNNRYAEKLVDTTKPERATCPDGGTCHHQCATQSMHRCWRVKTCAPLSGVFPENKWPNDVRLTHLTQYELDEEEARRYIELSQGAAATLCDFVEFLRDNNMGIVEFGEAGELHRHVDNFGELFAKFGGIDLEAVERHRLRVLEENRKRQENTDDDDEQSAT